MKRSHAVIPDFLSPDECAGVRELETEIEFEEGQTLGAGYTPSIRRSEISWFRRTEFPALETLFERLDQSVARLNAAMFDVDYNPLGCVALQYSIYRSVEKGAYDYHRDAAMPSNWPDARKLSFVIQMSAPDEYEGGKFAMLDGDDLPDLAGRQGALIVFPSLIQHAVLPVTSGERRSLVGWYRGPPWR